MFRRVSKILGDRFGKKDDLARQVKIAQVLAMYRDGARQLLGEAAEPVSLKNKVLTVKAQSAAHASELRLREHEIIAIINSHFGEEVIKRVLYRF